MEEEDDIEGTGLFSSMCYIGSAECTRIHVHPYRPPTLLNRCGEQLLQCRPSRMLGYTPNWPRIP